LKKLQETFTPKIYRAFLASKLQIDGSKHVQTDKGWPDDGILNALLKHNTDKYENKTPS